MMTLTNGYEQSDAERKIDIVNLDELEERARKATPTGGFGYIHLTHELRIVMQLAGTKTIGDVRRAKLLHIRTTR